MTILDSFTRESFPVAATSGELNPPGWTRGAFGLFFDLKLARWVLTHLLSRKVFQFHFLSIEAACEAVLELEALGLDWEQEHPHNFGDRLLGRKVLTILKQRAEPAPDHLSDVKRRLAELIADG